jgi:hypothetical protein
MNINICMFKHVYYENMFHYSSNNIDLLRIINANTFCIYLVKVEAG